MGNAFGPGSASRPSATSAATSQSAFPGQNRCWPLSSWFRFLGPVPGTLDQRMLRPSLFPVFGRRRSRSAGFRGSSRSRFENDPEVWALMIDNPLSRFPGIKVKNSMCCFLYC